MKEHLALLLTALNVFPGVNLRQDSKFTAILSKELDHVMARVYDIVYPAFKARQLIPVNNEVDTGAETFSYVQWDGVGIAQIIANYGDDIPMIEVLAEEFTQKIEGMSLGYSYSIQDLRRASTGMSRLSDKRARFVRRGVEQKIENIAATGDANTKLTGLANNANITLLAPITGTWSGATGAQIVADLLHFESQQVVINKETFPMTTIALPIALMQRLKSARISTTGDTHTTALQAFLASSESVTEVVSWNKLAEADAAGTGPRIVGYAKERDVVELVIPQEFEQFPPQQDNLAFKVPTHARIGGVVWYLPIGGLYMDGC